MTERPSEEADAGPAGSVRISPIRAGLTGRCPRCGRGGLFSGFLTIAPECGVCELDFTPIDTGDGPAVFAVLILGFVVTFAALAVEVVYTPPYWLHAVLWAPLTGLGALALLRPFKGLLACLQYYHGAREPGGDSFDDG